MAEFNPYKLEEEKWTPKNVYEILPPNSVSWSDYDFGQGTDNVDQEAANKSLIDGFIDFFSDLFGTAGQILGGAIELGGVVLGGFVNGVASLIGGIANAIGSIFGGGSGESPDLPLFNPIKTNLEAAIKPQRDKINESLHRTEEILAEQLVLRGQMDESLEEMRDASRRAGEASERAGAAIERAEAARAAATEARETLEEYNTALTKQIRDEFNAAVGRANTAVDKADSLAGELADFKTQAATDVGNALSKAQAASDELAALAPQVDEAISNASAASNKADQTLSDYTAWAAAQKSRIDTAVSKAEKATSGLAALTPQVADAVAKSSKATSDVSALTPKVTDAVTKAGAAVAKADQTLSEYTAWASAQKTRIDSAVSKAEKAASDLATLSPKVTDAVNKASKATSDVSALTPKVSAAQSRADSAYAEAGKVRSEVTPKIEAAQTKGESALAVADTAVDWLKNPTEIGSSLIAVNPETKRPYYADKLELVDDNPPGTSGPTYMSPASMTSETTYGPYVPVDSKIKYTVSFWAKANKAGSIFYGQLRTQEGRRVAPDGSPPLIGTVDVSNPPQPSNRNESGEYVHRNYANSYFIHGLEPQTKWTYYETEVQFAEGVTAVSISTMYWSHTDGVPADQYISGLDIRPQIPTQASVDQAQNDAIKANQDILRQQEEINEAQRVANLAQQNFNDNQKKWSDGVDVALATQKTVNDNFKKWTDGATEAIEANKNAIKALNAPQMGTSVIPLMPGTQTPAWTVNADLSGTNPTNIADGDPTWYKFDGTRDPGSYNLVAVDSSLEYDFSVWIHGTHNSRVYVELRDQDGNHAVKSGGITSYTQNNSSIYLIENMELREGWRKISTRLTLRPGVKFINVNKIYGNHPNGVAGSAYLADMRLAPHVPTQAQVDDAQNKALEAHDLLFEKQDEWNDGVTAALDAQKKVDDNFKKWSDGATTAIEANTTAIKALSKIDTGESVIAYLTPTDAEVKAGTAEYDVPVWTTATQKKLASNHSVVESLPSRRKGVYGVEKGYGNHRPNTVKVRVRPHTKYLWSFWSYGSGNLVIYMYGDGGYPVKATRQIKVNQAAQEEARTEDGRRVYDSAQNGNSSNSNGTQWLINGFDFGSHGTWKYNMYEVEFTSTTTEVWFDTFYWNWSKASTAGQYLADMQFYPDVPTQAQVDDAQNKAIESLNILAAKQGEWSDGAQKAIDANRDVATALARINGIQIGGRNLLRESLFQKTTSDYLIYRFPLGDYKPQEGEEVTFSIKAKPGKGNTRFMLYNSNGNGTSSLFDLFINEQVPTPDGVYKATGKWKVAGGNTHLNVYAYPSSVTTPNEIEWVKLERGNQATDWSLAPEDLPTQKQVDDAQSDAIRANTEALKALGKKSLGASLVPYKTPSDQEVKDYADEKLDYDPWADPEYFDAGHSVAANSIYGRYARATSSQGTKSYEGTLVSVDSSIEYRVKFDAYAQDTGSILVVSMQDQNGSTAVQSTSVRDQGTMGNTVYPIHYLTLKKGWNSYSGKIKFKPTTTEVRLSTFYWNHPNGVSTLQGFTNLEIVPDIPDANVVNMLQDQAILENTTIGKENKAAIDALKDGLDASIELEEVNGMLEELRGELADEERERVALQEEVDALQTEMIPRTIVSDDRVLYDDNVTLSGTKVTAKGSWAGQLAVTYIERTGYGSSSNPYVYKTRVTRKSVPEGSTRSWTFSSGVERVDYWVYRGRQRTILLANAGPYITGSSFSSGTWGVLATHKVGKTYGTGKIEWRANLQFADRGVTYRFKIEVNGTEIKNYKWSGVGPLTSLGDGKRTLKFEHEFNLPDDATVRVLGYAYNSNSQQARVSLLQGTLVYVQDTAREAQ